jgi:predicted nucleic acid-binding protein
MGRKKKTAGGSFVLDCSVAVAWFFEDEADAYAEGIEDALASATAVVPSLWPLEVGNALLMGERRKRTSEAKVTQFVALLRSLPIAVDEETTTRAWSEVLTIARGHQLSTYDAAYLELAMRRALPLATMDEKLKTAADAVGVRLYANR